MQTHYHWQVVKAKFVCKHGACQQVGDLQCKCGTISVARRYEISHFVMNADAESSVDVISVEQPAHADQHQVQIVNGRALDDPVHSTCHELNTHTHNTPVCSCPTVTPRYCWSPFIYLSWSQDLERSCWRCHVQIPQPDFFKFGWLNKFFSWYSDWPNFCCNYKMRLKIWLNGINLADTPDIQNEALQHINMKFLTWY